jgi:hypothetical protein
MQIAHVALIALMRKGAPHDVLVVIVLDEAPSSIAF